MNNKYHINLKCFFQMIEAIYEDQLLLAAEAKKKKQNKTTKLWSSKTLLETYSMSCAMLLADNNKLPAMVID